MADASHFERSWLARRREKKKRRVSSSSPRRGWRARRPRWAGCCTETGHDIAEWGWALSPISCVVVFELGWRAARVNPQLLTVAQHPPRWARHRTETSSWAPLLPRTSPPPSHPHPSPPKIAKTSSKSTENSNDGTLTSKRCVVHSPLAPSVTLSPIRNTRKHKRKSGSLASETSNSERNESTSHSLRSLACR